MHLNDNGRLWPEARRSALPPLLLGIFGTAVPAERPRAGPRHPGIGEGETGKTLETGRAYRESAHLFLFFTVICLLVGLALMFDSGWLAMAASRAGSRGRWILLKRIEQV